MCVCVCLICHVISLIVANYQTDIDHLYHSIIYITVVHFYYC